MNFQTGVTVSQRNDCPHKLIKASLVLHWQNHRDTGCPILFGAKEAQTPSKGVPRIINSTKALGADNVQTNPLPLQLPAPQMVHFGTPSLVSLAMMPNSPNPVVKKTLPNWWETAREDGCGSNQSTPSNGFVWPLFDIRLKKHRFLRRRPMTAHAKWVCLKINRVPNKCWFPFGFA